MAELNNTPPTSIEQDFDENQIFKVEDTPILRCYICGGTDYTLFEHWPGSKYCSKCGLKMEIPNFSKMNNLNEATKELNETITRMEVRGLAGLFGWDFPVDAPVTAEMVVKKVDRLLTMALNAICEIFRGEDSPLLIKSDYDTRVEFQRQYIQKLRKEREAAQWN